MLIDWQDVTLTFTPVYIPPYGSLPPPYVDHSGLPVFAAGMAGVFLLAAWLMHLVRRAKASPEFLANIHKGRLPRAHLMFRTAILLLAGVAVAGFAASLLYGLWPKPIVDINNVDYGFKPGSFLFFLAKTSSPDSFTETNLDTVFSAYSLLLRALCYLVVILGLRLMALGCAAQERRLLSLYPIALLLGSAFALLAATPANTKFSMLQVQIYGYNPSGAIHTE